MANDRFEDLESPFLDAEVLPPVMPAEAELSFEDFTEETVQESDEDSVQEIDEEESESDAEDEGEVQFEDDYVEPEMAGIESEDSDLETEASAGAPADGIDEAAAQPLFPPAVRERVGPLLDARKMAGASAWNSAQHPAVSGISLATLTTRLTRYVDEAAVRRAMRDDSALKDRVGDINTLLAVMAHQFQQKTYAKPAHHDGKIGEGTLDALGFVRHRGASLNAVDAANVKFHVEGRSKAFVRLQQLYASDRAAFEELGADVTPDTWFRRFVKAPFLGRPFVFGIHLELMRRLRKAETWLLQQPAYRSMSPVELGAALGIDEDHRGGRAKNNNSMHTLGLATDIGYVKNPWVAGQFDSNGKPSKNRNGAFKAVTLNVSRLLHGTDEGLTAQWLQQLGSDPALTTAAAYTEVHRRDKDLKEYLSLERDAERLRAAITRRTANKPGESIDAAVVRWRETIETDRAKLKNAFGGRTPANGFMNHHRDLVIALRDHGCLAWGGIDLGRNASGDMMHFDCRATGIGWKLSLKAQRTAGANHKCAIRTSVAQRPPAAAPVAESAAGASVDFLGGRLWTITARTLPMRVGVFCPARVKSPQSVDVLVYAHGLLSPCKPQPKKVPRDLITEQPFELGKLVHDSSNAIVLVVPFMDWSAVTQNKLGFGRNNHQHLLGKPANVNGVVAEVLSAIGREFKTSTPVLQNLMLAGHSRAYDFFDPLAHAHADPEMSQGALSKLSRVWAFDTTYHCVVDDWKQWLSAKPNLLIHVFYRDVPKTKRCGEALQKAASATGGRLAVTVAEEGHCAVPKRRLPELLTLPLAPPTRTEEEFDFEQLEEPEDFDETFTDDSEAEVELDDESAEEGVLEGELEAEQCEQEEDGEREEFVEFEDRDATTASVKVIVDQPSESDDKYQLLSTDGKYSKTLSARDAKPLVAGETVLTFTGVSPAKSYKLIHIRSKGSKRVVLPDMPFKALTEANYGPRDAKHTFVTLPSQVPRRLPDRFGHDQDVDPMLIARSPQLADLVVEDPKL